jgi:single stranded DNA-binding protein
MQTNRVELTGHLADRAQERRLPSGTRVANARLAQSYIYDSKDGAKRHTNWFSLAFYGEMATTAARFEKGDKLNIIGTIEQRQFTPKDGSPRIVYEVIVKECRLVAKAPSLAGIVEHAQTKDQLTDALLNASEQSTEEVDAWTFV